jgi:hypothetical protein
MFNTTELSRQQYAKNMNGEWEQLFENAFNRQKYTAAWRFSDHFSPMDGGWIPEPDRVIVPLTWSAGDIR